MSMVVCRAPFRVCFFGGSSDYPEWCRDEPGAVLSTTIDKYIYITCRYLLKREGVRTVHQSNNVILPNDG